jgi:hypothetical protein
MQLEIVETDIGDAGASGATISQALLRVRPVGVQGVSSHLPRPFGDCREVMQTKHNEFWLDRPPGEVLN